MSTVLDLFLFSRFLFPPPSPVSNILILFQRSLTRNKLLSFLCTGSPHIQHANLMPLGGSSLRLCRHSIFSPPFLFFFFSSPRPFFFNARTVHGYPQQHSAFNLRCQHRPILRKSDCFAHLCFHLHIQHCRSQIQAAADMGNEPRRLDFHDRGWSFNC